MRSLIAPAVAAVVAATVGCGGETLDAGSTHRAPLVADPRTRATFAAMIDAVAMDATSLYLTCEDGWLYRVEKAGTSPPVRVAPASAPGSSYTEGIALDDTHVYWTALGDGLAGGEVLRAPKSGGATEVLASKQTRPFGIALDGDALYWADQGGAPPVDSNVDGIGKGTILRASKSGASPVSFAKDLNAPDSLAVDGGVVIWHEGFAIRSVPVAGGDPRDVLTLPTVFRTPNLVASGGRVVWAENDGENGSIWSSDAAGDVANLAADIDPPASLAISRGALDWNVATGADVGAIYAVPLAGGDEAALAPSDQRVGSSEHALFLLADEDAFYSIESFADATLTVEIRVLAR